MNFIIAQKVGTHNYSMDCCNLFSISWAFVGIERDWLKLDWQFLWSKLVKKSVRIKTRETSTKLFTKFREHKNFKIYIFYFEQQSRIWTPLAGKLVPAVAINGNTVQMAELGDSQVNANMVQTRANVGRLTQILRNLKGQLTRELYKLQRFVPSCPNFSRDLFSWLNKHEQFWSATPTARLDGWKWITNSQTWRL